MSRCCSRHLIWVALTFISLVGADAGTMVPGKLSDFTSSSSRVFRGRCVAADVGTADVAGARIPVTTYTFHVTEHLKGAGAETITFRQVGTRGGGARDLGRLVGMPIYVPGTEYVLFLLPEGPEGLTSPAGAAQGVLVVSGEQVRGLLVGSDVSGALPYRSAGAEAAQPSPNTISYEALRHAVLDQVRR